MMDLGPLSVSTFNRVSNLPDSRPQPVKRFRTILLIWSADSLSPYLHFSFSLNIDLSSKSVLQRMISSIIG